MELGTDIRNQFSSPLIPHEFDIPDGFIVDLNREKFPLVQIVSFWHIVKEDSVHDGKSLRFSNDLDFRVGAVEQFYENIGFSSILNQDVHLQGGRGDEVPYSAVEFFRQLVHQVIEEPYGIGHLDPIEIGQDPLYVIANEFAEVELHFQSVTRLALAAECQGLFADFLIAFADDAYQFEILVHCRFQLLPQ